MAPSRALRAKQRRIREQFVKFRQRYLFSQAQLAEALGVSRRTVQYVETGNAQNPDWTCIPSRRTLERFQGLQAKCRQEERNWIEGRSADRLHLYPAE